MDTAEQAASVSLIARDSRWNKAFQREELEETLPLFR